MATFDELLDMAEKVTDKVVGGLKDAHYPGKVYDDPIPDAVIVREETNIVFGSVGGPDNKGNYWHAFYGIGNLTICGLNVDPARIAQRKKPNTNAKDFYVVCYGCISKLTAFETHSETPKELTDGTSP